MPFFFEILTTRLALGLFVAPTALARAIMPALPVAWCYGGLLRIKGVVYFGFERARGGLVIIWAKLFSLTFVISLAFRLTDVVTVLT